MSSEINVGTNRTGTALARDRAEAMIDETEDLLPEDAAEPELVAAARAVSCAESEPIGTIPPPTSFKGLAKTALGSAKGEQPILFMDKLGERLAFEKSGVRLYETLLMKHAACGSFAGGPERAELEAILEEEDEHQRLLQAAIETLAGDPTAVTPSADLAGVAAAGIFTVLADPRTSVLQCLEAIVLAELADNEGWETLVALAELAGEPALRETFAQARADEAEHLVRLRAWIAAGQGRAAIKEEPAPRPRVVRRKKKSPARRKAKSARKRSAVESKPKRRRR